MNFKIFFILVSSLLSVCDGSTGLTPLHIATKQGKTEFIKGMVSASATTIRFDSRDAQGNTVYHFAAQVNKETIEVCLLFFQFDFRLFK